MNANTAFIMFAVMAAFGLATATIVIPILNEAHAAGAPCFRQDCREDHPTRFNHPGGPGGGPP
jgi:hypothetical protein